MDKIRQPKLCTLPRIMFKISWSVHLNWKRILHRSIMDEHHKNSARAQRVARGKSIITPNPDAATSI